MKFRTALPSRLLLDSTLRRTKMPLRAVRAFGAENLTAEKKKPSETLTERFRELAVIRFNRVSACCGMCHNFDYDLYGTEIRCANRLYIFENRTNV